MREQSADRASDGKFAKRLAVQASAENLAGHKGGDYLYVDHMLACPEPPEGMLVVHKVAANAGLQSAVSADAVPALGERLTRRIGVAATPAADTLALGCS